MASTIAREKTWPAVRRGPLDIGGYKLEGTSQVTGLWIHHLDDPARAEVTEYWKDTPAFAGVRGDKKDMLKKKIAREKTWPAVHRGPLDIGGYKLEGTSQLTGLWIHHLDDPARAEVTEYWKDTPAVAGVRGDKKDMLKKKGITTTTNLVQEVTKSMANKPAMPATSSKTVMKSMAKKPAIKSMAAVNGMAKGMPKKKGMATGMATKKKPATTGMAKGDAKSRRRRR